MHKDRQRWHVPYKATDFAINLDQVLEPSLPGYFLEIRLVPGRAATPSAKPASLPSY